MTKADPKSWGFPSFARGFPEDEALDELVALYAAGDYLAASEGAKKLAASAEKEEVKAAALVIVERVKPDPASRVLLLATAALLALLTGWWVTHDGPPKDGPPAPAGPVPTVEIIR